MTSNVRFNTTSIDCFEGVQKSEILDGQFVLPPRAEFAVKLGWRASYDDGNVIENNGSNRPLHLDPDGLRSFQLVNVNDAVLVDVPLTDSRRLFYRMRVSKHVASVRWGVIFAERSTLAGYRERVKGIVHTRYWIVKPDGKVEEHDRFVPNSYWLCEPNWQKEEMV